MHALSTGLVDGRLDLKRGDEQTLCPCLPDYLIRLSKWFLMNAEPARGSETTLARSKNWKIIQTKFHWHDGQHTCLHRKLWTNRENESVLIYEECGQLHRQESNELHGPRYQGVLQPCKHPIGDSDPETLDAQFIAQSWDPLTKCVLNHWIRAHGYVTPSWAKEKKRNTWAIHHRSRQISTWD